MHIKATLSTGDSSLHINKQQESVGLLAHFCPKSILFTIIFTLKILSIIYWPMPPLYRIASEVAVQCTPLLLTFTRPRHSRRTQLFKTAEKLSFNEHPFISAPLKNCGKPGKKFIWHFGWLWWIKSSDQMKWTDLVWAVDLSLLLSVRWFRIITWIGLDKNSLVVTLLAIYNNLPTLKWT